MTAIDIFSLVGVKMFIYLKDTLIPSTTATFFMIFFQEWTEFCSRILPKFSKWYVLKNNDRKLVYITRIQFANMQCDRKKSLITGTMSNSIFWREKRLWEQQLLHVHTTHISCYGVNFFFFRSRSLVLCFDFVFIGIQHLFFVKICNHLRFFIVTLHAWLRFSWPFLRSVSIHTLTGYCMCVIS